MVCLRRLLSGMFEAGKDFRRLKAYKQLPTLEAALEKHWGAETSTQVAPVVPAA